jgi:YrbI family 3-deoxy-D-manno-octulosonate 8-phosphate phosphatase
VVAARCQKMNIPCIQGIADKETAIKELMKERGLEAENVIYCGNDVNDLPCFPLVGWAAAVADSVPEVVRQADYVLSHAGGYGAVRELCELVLANDRD